MKHPESYSITATYAQCYSTRHQDKKATVATALPHRLVYISFFDSRKRKRNTLIIARNLLKNVEVYDFEISQTEIKYVMFKTTVFILK
jgi:protein subunit release factor B